MMKKLISLFLALLMLASTAVIFSSCGDEKADEGRITRIVITAGTTREDAASTAKAANAGKFESLAAAQNTIPADMPCVELFTDANNVVVAATALNDDGAVLIIGEKLVGEDADDAVEKIVSLAVTTGYIPSDDGADDTAAVTISVSGSDKFADKLQKATEQAATEALAAHEHVKAAVETAEAAHVEDLRAELVEKQVCTEEEAQTLTEHQIYSMLSAERIETALLITTALKDAYYRARDYRLALTKREATAAVIKSMGGLYTLMSSAYSLALDQYGKVIDKLEEARYNFLVSPDSAYQKSIVSLYEARAELVSERRICAGLTEGTEEYALAMEKVHARQEKFDAALAVYIELGDKLNESLKTLIASLRSFETTLEEIENKLPDDITDALYAKAEEINACLNSVKDTFFTAFEVAHADDIAAIEAKLIARKEALQEAAGVVTSASTDQ